MSIAEKLTYNAQIEVNASTLQKHHISMNKFVQFAKEFTGVYVTIDGSKVMVTAASLSTLVDFEKNINVMIGEAQTLQNSSLLDGSEISRQQQSLAHIQSNSQNGAGGADYEWSDAPIQQPQDGYTVSEIIDGSFIKRKFRFAEGQINIPGDVIRYCSFECIIKLPPTSDGYKIDSLLKNAFIKRKLFYIGRDIHGSGFSIQSAYQLLPSNGSEENIPTSKFTEIENKLQDLGISDSPAMTSQSDSSVLNVRTQEPQVLPAAETRITEQLVTSSIRENVPSINKSSLRYPQPDGLVLNSEFHKKDLKGFRGYGAIHMYFRFDGGTVSSEGHETVQYLAYHKTGCLPANVEGRKLYGMIEKAAKSKKLFVVAYKAGKFIIRSKLRFLSSDDYPDQSYLQCLFEDLLKLGIQPMTSVPPLPRQSEAHHVESSDDDEDDMNLATMKKRGPFEQPEKGMLRLEKDSTCLKGHHACGTIMVYIRFAGGKMKIEGYKSSKSFDIPYSQVNIVAALPGNNDGKVIATMLQSAFRRRLLFHITKNEGEPSFRVRPKVHLITAQEYPKNGYLMRLKKQLRSLGIPEPTSNEVESLVIHENSSPQRSAASPSLPTARENCNVPATQPYYQNNTGARPKQRIPSASNTANNQQRNPRGIRPEHAWKVHEAKPTNRAASDTASDSLSPVTKHDQEEDKCPICLGSLSQLPCKKLSCGHEFHQACVDMALKTQANKTCPYCKQPTQLSNPHSIPAAKTPSFVQAQAIFSQPAPSYNNLVGGGNIHQQNNIFVQRNFQNSMGNPTRCNLPNGVMSTTVDHRPLQGHEGYRTIVIRYVIPSGVQQIGHPNPGQPYDGTNREAFLPDNGEGQNLLKLLRNAFDSGLTFTIGRSQTTGRDNQIIWNGIPHKTNTRGGKASHGYPDRDYLDELRRALASKGIQ